ncbi:hypothetical protein MHK_004698, partial [Candidatus Magnetomorum sp. HK-1]
MSILSEAIDFRAYKNNLFRCNNINLPHVSIVYPV